MITACIEHGTLSETGQRPRLCELTGEALLPIIDRATGRLVQEQLLIEVSDGEF